MVLEGVLYHHEKMDGSGYPYRLTETHIPFMGKIVGVADAFHAMISNRVYQTSKGIQEALQQLRIGCNSHFSEEVVEAFHKALLKEELSSIVMDEKIKTMSS